MQCKTNNLVWSVLKSLCKIENVCSYAKINKYIYIYIYSQADTNALVPKVYLMSAVGP